jgi:hypothetical protein
VSSFEWDDGLVLSVSVYVSQIIDAYGRKVCWISQEEDDAICLYYRPEIGEFCCFVMVDWMPLFSTCVSCPEFEWTGDDEAWHTLTIQLDGSGFELSRDGVVDFALDDDSLAYFARDGFIQLSTLGSLCCFDDVSLTSLTFHECGDADRSGAVDIDDAVYLVDYIFSGGPGPDPYESGDADCSALVDIGDVVYLIAYILAGGNAPCDSAGDGVPDC